MTDANDTNLERRTGGTGQGDATSDLDARLQGRGTDPEDTVDRASTDPLIDPSWPSQAQRIIGERHAKSAAQPGDAAAPTTNSEDDAAEIDGPKSQTEPVNMEYEHENQARWRETRM